MKALVLDTNVWLDYFLAERPGHADAFRFVDAAVEAEVPLLVASHSMKDFWYLFWQSNKHANAREGSMEAEEASQTAKHVSWAVVEHISDLATVVGSDESDAWLARKMRSTHDDYEDNLVVAAALRAKPDLLVSSDQALIAHCPVAAATPKDALGYLELL